jgi:hypothetical protein
LLQYSFGDAEAMVVFWFCMGLALALHRVLSDASSPWQKWFVHSAASGIGISMCRARE